MPVVGTPVTGNNAGVDITMDDIRGVILDWPQYNLLLDDVQFTNAEISRAARLATDRFNAMPPRTSHSVSSFPNRFVLVMGAVGLLSMGESFRQARNQMTYQAGDITPIGIDDKAALFAQLKADAWNEFLRVSREWKTQDNLESCFGGLGSGYAYSSAYSTYWR